MKTKNWAFEVEDIHVGLKNLAGLSYAVYEVLFRGAFTPETYEGAVFILLKEAERLAEETEKIVKGMYEEQKNEKR